MSDRKHDWVNITGGMACHDCWTYWWANTPEPAGPCPGSYQEPAEQSQAVPSGEVSAERLAFEEAERHLRQGWGKTDPATLYAEAWGKVRFHLPYLGGALAERASPLAAPAETSGDLTERPVEEPATAAMPASSGFINLALNTLHPKCHEAAKAFWDYWEANGETHKHGYYESTWGAINRAIRLVGIVQHDWKNAHHEQGASPPAHAAPPAAEEVKRLSEVLRAALHPELKTDAEIARIVKQWWERQEFCWLVELFLPGGNSLGWYHTGFTDISNNSRSTQSPWEAKRYATKEEAERVASRMLHKQGVWRAVEHGFGIGGAR